MAIKYQPDKKAPAPAAKPDKKPKPNKKGKGGLLGC
jgi:hypothetical protein